MRHRSPTPRIVRKRELRAEAVLDTAMTVLEAEGLDGLTLARVADRLELVPAALYRYFASKDALLAALQRRAISEIGGVIAQTLAAVGELKASPDVLSLARLLAAARAYGELPARAPQAWHLVSTMLGNPRALLSADEARQTSPMLTALLTALKAGLEDAADTHALARGDASARTVAFWGALHGVLVVGKLKQFAPHFPAPETVGALAIESLLSGWGAKAAVLARAKKVLGGRS